MTDTQRKPCPSQHICNWWPCLPSSSAHMGNSRSTDPPPSCLRPKAAHARAPTTTQAPRHSLPSRGFNLRALGQKDVLFSPALWEPGHLSCSPALDTRAYGRFIPHTPTSTEQTNYPCAPSQAEENTCRTRGCGSCIFPSSAALLAPLLADQEPPPTPQTAGRRAQEPRSWAPSHASRAAVEMLHPK